MVEEWKYPLVKTALKVLKEVKGKALVLMGDFPRPPSSDVLVVVVGSHFDLRRKMLKKITLPPNLDLKHSLDIISAFLLREGGLSIGDVFVYVGPDFLGLKKIKAEIPIEKSVFTKNPSVLQRVLEIAVELSVEGREGRRIGTIFVIGDTRAVLENSKQMIPNPFKGHRIYVTNEKHKEVIKEFSQIDGAMVINEKGRVVAGGRYLEVGGIVSILELSPGLGSRHIAAAGITKLTRATAVCLSEGGTIRIFREGRMVLEYNPRS